MWRAGRSCRAWTVKECLINLDHTDEIFSVTFNYESDTIITGSKDNTCIIWKDEKAFNEVM